MTAGALQAHDDVQTLAAYARQRALQYPDRVALCESGRTISYRTLLEEAQALAGGLWQIGLRRGDVVSFQLPNWIEAAIINLAANLLGLQLQSDRADLSGQRAAGDSVGSSHALLLRAAGVGRLRLCGHGDATAAEPA